MLSMTSAPPPPANKPRVHVQQEDILAEARANNSQILLSYEQVANKDNYDTKNSVVS